MKKYLLIWKEQTEECFDFQKSGINNCQSRRCEFRPLKWAAKLQKILIYLAMGTNNILECSQENFFVFFLEDL